MSDTYSAVVTPSALTGSTTDWTETITATGGLTEVFRADILVADGAADTSVVLAGLTDPKVLVVIGDVGISFKLDAGGTDAIGADPVAVVSDEGSGLAISEILMSNGDSVAHTVTIVAFE